MQVKHALSARGILKAKIRVVAAVSIMRVLPLCTKKYQSLQKKHVKSGLFWIESGLSLDSVWTSWRRLRVKCEGPAGWPGLFGFVY